MENLYFGMMRGLYSRIWVFSHVILRMLRHKENGDGGPSAILHDCFIAWFEYTSEGGKRGCIRWALTLVLPHPRL